MGKEDECMKIVHWFLGMTAILSVIVILLISSFEIGIYSDFGWYEKEYEKYNVTEDLEMKMDDVMDVTEEMMAYLRGDREDLVVWTTVNGEKQEFFNDREKAHMVDVQNLFLGGLTLRFSAIIVLVISLSGLIFTKGNWKRILPKSFLTGLGAFLVISGGLGVLCASDFNKYFFLFHEIFFDNDLWLLDPATDLMIRMLPEGFFFDMVIRIGSIFIGMLAILLILSMLILHRQKANKKSLIGVVCQKDMNTEDPKIEDLYATGVVADIVRVLEMPDGTTTVILQGKKRFQLEELSAYDPYLIGKIKLLEDVMPDKSDREFEALVSTIKDLTIKMLGAASEPPRDLIFSIKNNKNILYLINFSCCNVPNGSSEKQDLLLIGNLKDRAYRLLFILNREYQLVELKTSIQMKTHEDINQQQKEYFLQQQIKTIQEELGGNINDLEIRELREKAAKKKWSPAVAETFEKEVRKLERLHPQSPDFSIQTQYVQAIVNLPWNEYSKDNFNLAHAQKVLDRDHYGLEKVKERIIEHLAVLKLKTIYNTQ